jgi:hypothetical protein
MTKNLGLGRLTKVDVRDIWESEAREFTPWLAQPENLTILGEALNMELEMEARERDVGPFKADLLCKDLIEDAWVLIENQLERTDHKHLGQLLTYAAGLGADTVVWIATEFTEEHRAALDRLNAITGEKFRFFGVEVELWKIGESPAAPKFNIVSKPNDWARSVGRAARRIEAEDLSGVKSAQLEFWTQLRERLNGHSVLKARKPRPQHWAAFSIGRSGFQLSAISDTRNQRIGVELYINHVQSKSAFDQLFARKSEIEARLGFSVEWMRLPGKDACRIARYLVEKDPVDENYWPEYLTWIVATLEKFYAVFSMEVRSLTLDDDVEDDLKT